MSRQDRPGGSAGIPAGRRATWRRLLGAALLLLPAAACAPQAPSRPVAVAPGQAPLAALPVEPPRNRVGLLLPLSGGNRALGQAMLNASQLALFDQGDPGIELLPRDTGSTAAGAGEAARVALAEGAKAFAGPLTLGETAAAAGAARASGAPVLAYTSDASQAGRGVWVMGLTPGEQAERMLEAAAAAGARRVGLLAADDEFGRRLGAGLRARATALGLPAPLLQLHARLGDVAAAARELAEKAQPDGLDAVLLGHGGERARQAAAALVAALPMAPRFLGTALWAGDASLAQEPALAGAWFPGPDPQARAGFDSRYQAAFGEKPPRLAGVAYDAAALAARAVREPGGNPPLGQPMLGADGPILLAPNGLAQRGLAIFAVDPAGEPTLVEPAPIPGSPAS
ncbi:penicillin-binding protein activator [Roseicella frigidaeris]|uniref:penicillin-binding protein activator n=1 Tax=Roseicella frigidaeris TaxID=2230885 RepID=UPI001402C2A5|nr:penicillin-binding protein activator [Roseicella frigidaeris]